MMPKLPARPTRLVPASWRRYLLCALAVVLFSEIFLNFELANFRISTSVMVLPLLLLTLTAADDPLVACTWSSAAVLLARTAISLLQGGLLPQAMLDHLPAAIYYLAYGVIFRLFCPIQAVTIPKGPLLVFLTLCDFSSNMVELFFDWVMAFPGFSLGLVPILACIALVRALGSCLLLVLYCQYHALLTRAEHEERYQRLFLMKTRMRSELYFLSKDKVRIEDSVKAAYQLYEQLSGNPAVPKATSRLALQVACDIHDLKKDYIRIEQGFHEELGDRGDSTRSMQFATLLQILRDSTQRMLGEGSGIRLHFSCLDDFLTVEHYTLASILRCLVNNSIEAMQAHSSHGWVELRQWREGASYHFTVADNGPGIAPKHIHSIFQMGFSTKFDQATGNIYRGMGLPNVKMLVEEQLKGTVTVTSEPNKRTEFHLTIPADILEVPR